MTSDPAAFFWIAAAAGMVLMLLGLVAVKAVVRKMQARSRQLQEQDERLALRCDELDARLEKWITQDRVEHLSDLVRAGARGGRLTSEVAEALEAYLQDLRDPEDLRPPDLRPSESAPKS